MAKMQDSGQLKLGEIKSYSCSTLGYTYYRIGGVIKAVSGPASYIAQTSWLRITPRFCLLFFFIWLPIC
ncbi:hypothetical protein TRIATDRAFT_298804 [Trichoderma atroviride IMI 206040]|uniref:Uncharacterized protein n=1 Tax=Hypocrea atroviridis (strain ATCC 20476 / IMI 206040) TaxID=452589 RepID=G9NQW0_HYPAI|nr:uncharacterized protein TRIATDRAFT_298804 [Trichoderma atroviride IMI 206040]EHK46930.1 hypothetical protein TRIATDRAFT_298804 [Trichoderma atroviride IMI 206040]